MSLIFRNIKITFLIVTSCVTGAYFQSCADGPEEMRKSIVKLEAGRKESPIQKSKNIEPKTETDFAQTLYPLVKDKCGACHSETTSPLFAANDQDLSEKVLVESKKIDFNAPEKSRLVQRLKSDAHNCWGNCSDNATEMAEAIRSWAERVGKNTKSQEINGLLLSDATNSNACTDATTSDRKYLCFDISDRVKKTGVFFGFEIESFAEGKGYLLVNPTIVTPHDNLKLKKLDIIINGNTYPQYSTYHRIEGIYKSGRHLLSDASMVMAIDKTLDKDQFSVKFHELSFEQE